MIEQRSLLQRVCGASFGAALACLLLAGCGPGADKPADVSPAGEVVSTEGVPEEHFSDVIAVVNGVNVYRSTYDEILDILRERIEAGDSDAVERYIGARMGSLEKAIDEELLFQEAVRKGYDPSPSGVRQAYLARVGKAGTERALLVSAGSRRVSKSEILHSIRRTIAIERFVKAEVESHITTGEEEVRGYYDARPDLFTPDPWVKVGHIFVRAPIEWDTPSRAAALSKISVSLEKIRKGRSFESVARGDSEDDSAPAGGVLGYFKRGMLPERIDRAVFDLQPGAISEVVESDTGYHILKVFERKGGKLEAFDAIKDVVREKLVARKRGQDLAAIVDRLRGPAKIERRLQ